MKSPLILLGYQPHKLGKNQNRIIFRVTHSKLRDLTQEDQVVLLINEFWETHPALSFKSDTEVTIVEFDNCN